MRLRTGHRPDDWSENVPASASLGGHGGALVVGGLRPATGAGLTPTQQGGLRLGVGREGRPRLSGDIEMNGRGRKYATHEERLAARRQAWRESEQRKRETQRDHRSKVRAEIAALREGYGA